MADAQKNHLYREESLKGLHSPEDLETYVMVNRPWWWAVGLGIFVVVISLSLWLFFGHLPRTEALKAVVVDSETLSTFVDARLYNASDLQGDYVNVGYGGSNIGQGTVVSFDSQPYSASELEDQLSSDWLRTNLVTSQFMCRVGIRMDGPIPLSKDTLCDVTITVSDKHPIEYLIKER